MEEIVRKTSQQVFFYFALGQST